MESLFQWFDQLTQLQVALLCASVAIIMAVIPFARQILAFFLSVFGTRDPEIHDFRYSLSGYFTNDGKEDLFVEGTRIHFHWKVSNVRRVDLEPVGRRLRGISASSVIDSKKRLYTLRAYGFFGKMRESVIEIPKDRFRRISNTELSACTHLVCDLPKVANRQLTKQLPANHPIRKRLPVSGLHIIRNDIYVRHLGRTDLNLHIYPSQLRRSLYRRLQEARLLKGLRLSPRRYDTAVETAKKQMSEGQP